MIKVSAREFSDRFDREAQAISSLNHPNVCTLYDVATSPEGFGYLVMEFVEGDALAHLIKQGPLPLDKVLQCGVQIAGAPSPDGTRFLLPVPLNTSRITTYTVVLNWAAGLKK
jgi:serine/threonine protein kinase